MSKTTSTSTRLYIVHAAEDGALAAFLKRECEAAVPGVRVFVASKPGQIPTGSDWLSEIHHNLSDATTYLFLLTPRSINRPWVWYEAGAAWRSGRPRLPVAAAGLERGQIPFPLAVAQTLVLDKADDAAQLFADLGGQLESPAAFCSRVRELALPLPSAGLDGARLREVHQAFGELGEPPKLVLRRMLNGGGLTLAEMGGELGKQRFVSDSLSVEKVLKALKDRQLVQGDFEGRWTIKPELKAALRECFEPPSLSTRMLQLSDELVAWVEGENGLIDPSAFNQRFRTKLNLLSEKAARDYAEGDPLLVAVPSSAGGVRNIARALAEVAKRIP